MRTHRQFDQCFLYAARIEACAIKPRFAWRVRKAGRIVGVVLMALVFAAEMVVAVKVGGGPV